MTERVLKSSDVVRSVNGGPEMTVQTVDDDKAMTIWWDSATSEFRTCDFPLATLKFVREMKAG